MFVIEILIKTPRIMKKYLLIVVIMMSGFAFSQDNNPVLEAEGQMVKATYYYANGNVQQVGYFKDGKLNGKWTSYDASGNIIEKNFFTDVVGVLEEKSTFTYDTRRNITGEKFYRNGILKQEKIYFYDVKNEFPQAVLTKYPDRKTIDLQNILIEFF